MGRRTVSLPSGDAEVEIIRSSRRTVALYVQPGGRVLVRAPWYVPVSILMNFVTGKSRWIERQIKRLKDVSPPGEPISVVPGSKVPFMGRQLEVQVVQGVSRNAKRHGDRLVLTVKGTASSEELTAMTEMWYLLEAKHYLPARTVELASMHPDLLPAPGSISVRKMKRRWGTCHSGGSIWLNRELMKKESDLIDYVIIHELCHLVHHNHGAQYYQLLEKILPDFREKRKRLRQQ